MQAPDMKDKMGDLFDQNPLFSDRLSSEVDAMAAEARLEIEEMARDAISTFNRRVGQFIRWMERRGVGSERQSRDA